MISEAYPRNNKQKDDAQNAHVVGYEKRSKIAQNGTQNEENSSLK